MSNHSHYAGTSVEMTGQTMTYGGAASAVAAWGLSLPELAAIVGAVVAVAGLVVQVWATVRRDRREKELHRKRMSDTPSSD